MSLIFSILILVFVPSFESVKINFDPYVTYENNDIIVKTSRLSCDNYETVNLNGASLSKIPRGFVKSSTIRSISLSNNYISEIPHDVFHDVPQLECLDLSYNNISISELSNFRHDHLKILIFDHQHTEWGNELSNDVVFHTLTANFPNVVALSLKTISYEHPSLYSLFPKLSTIYWEENNLVHLKSDFVDYFSSFLKVIHLERNMLTNFTVYDLKNVEELYLDNNPLESISIVISRNLKILSLVDCNMESTRDTRFPTLISLDLSRNQIKEIDTYDMSNLENLSLNYNRFMTVPHLNYVPRLKQLSLSYNSIESISFEIRIHSLRMLNLRGNKITYIDRSTFLNVPALEQLDLAENKLQSLPRHWGESLKMLRYINLKSNKFKSIVDIESYSLINLNHMFIGKNIFQTITENEIQNICNNCTVYVS